MAQKYFWDDKVILVVEDDTSSSLLLQAILSRTGARLLFAEDGESAVTLIENQSEIDMVLMDIRLKGLNGLEATSRIKQISPNTPVIAQTACAIIGDMESCYKAGCNAYLAKPINTQTLLETIDYYFKKSAVQDLLDTAVFTN